MTQPDEEALLRRRRPLLCLHCHHLSLPEAIVVICFGDYAVFRNIFTTETFPVAEVTFIGHSRSSAITWFDRSTDHI